MFNEGKNLTDVLGSSLVMSESTWARRRPKATDRSGGSGSFFRKRGDRMPTLDAHKRLLSDLWVDDPDALSRVEQRFAAGEISDTEAEQLRQFIEEGYVTTSLGLDKSFADAYARDVDRIWSERPVDLAVSTKSEELRSFRDVDENARRVGYRIADLHSHSAAALALYLHPRLFRLVELVFDDKALALQSLYFEWGSEQGLHRDPMFVPTKPASHLLAAWVALEDVGRDAGPFIYVPGSHRMPWFEFTPDSVRFADKTDGKRKAWVAYRDRMIEEMGLEAKSFTCKRGDALIFHAGLLHGGSNVRDERLTRKSFVVHYSTDAHYGSRWAQMRMNIDGNWVRVARKTRRRVTVAGHSGLDNPLHGRVRSRNAASQSRIKAAIAPLLRTTPKVRRALSGLARAWK